MSSMVDSLHASSALVTSTCRGIVANEPMPAPALSSEPAGSARVTANPNHRVAVVRYPLEKPFATVEVPPSRLVTLIFPFAPLPPLPVTLMVI